MRWPLTPPPAGARRPFAHRLRALNLRKQSLAVALVLLLALALTLDIGVAPVTGASSAQDGEIQLTEISTGFNNPIGIDHHEPTNRVVISVNYDSGMPNNFELVASDGSRTPFSNVSGLTDEVKIATVRDRRGGFTPGELFVGTGTPGVVARISADGSEITDPWVTLPDERGLMRGSLHVDRTGVWGGDLIVVTTTGGVWRISSSGAPTMLANVGTHLEGVTTVPNEERYGPWAGKVLAGAELEDDGRVYAIDADGNAESYDLDITPEDIDIIAPRENFYGVDFGDAKLWGAPPSEFEAIVGDVLIAQEHPGILWHVVWNGSEFETNEVARKEQWEHVTFSSAGVVEIAPTIGNGGGPSPALIAFVGLLVVLLGGGALFWTRRLRRAPAGAHIEFRRPAGRGSSTPVFAGTGPGEPLRADAWLDVVEPQELGRFPLGEDPVTVGFTGDCTICLPDGADQIGTRLRVWKREGRYMLHNLSRLGRVKVGGKSVTWAILEDGDIIELGASKLVFGTANQPAE